MPLPNHENRGRRIEAAEIVLAPADGASTTIQSQATQPRTVSAAAPADFQAAVTAGSKPRLQVITAGVVLPQQARVIAYNAGTHVCTLEAATLPAAWSTSPPQVGDAVFAGGPVVDTIAAAVLVHVDELGPSRVSGFADERDAWEDTLRIDRLVEIAMSATDASGVRMISDLAATPTIGGVAANKRAQDNTPDGPQLLYLASCAVTP